MIVATHLMETGFAHWRVWAANIRDSFPEGHPLREKSLLLCLAMDCWHTSWLLERRPDSAKNLTHPLEEPIEKLVSELIQLGVAPPAKPKDTKVQRNTAAHPTIRHSR
jgi:hypothetical protein